MNLPAACSDKKIDVGPIREQKNPWCIGMVAADILGNAAGQVFSVPDLVMQFNLSHIDYLRIIPELPVPQPLFQGSPGQSFKPILEFGMKGMCLEQNFHSGFVPSGRHSTDILRDFILQVSSGQITKEIKNEMQMVVPKAKNLSTQQYSIMTLPEISDQSCIPRFKTTDLEVVEKRPSEFASERDLISEIDHVLDLGLIVGIGLVADSIDSGRQISALDGHAVSIVGRRFGQKSKKCEYLVRNSWGKTWADGGYKYVPRDHLLSGIDMIAYLTKRNK